MFEYEIEKIRSVLIDILGQPKNEPYSSGWQSFCCPYCAAEDGVKSDGKYNMETNVEHGCYFHCWKCETRGKLSKLIRDFGNSAQMAEYKEILNTIRNSKLYQIGNVSGDVELIDVETYVSLPTGFKKINKNDKSSLIPLQYLYKRGITDDMIEKYNIGYTTYYCNDFTQRNRIIIPSYDEVGELNYWVGRDYTGKNKIKYCNPKIQKTSIVFNEGLLNWYENITLVEGPFDHIVVPNSIPLLGKSLTINSAVYKALKEKMDGVRKREKFRLRYYNEDKSFIRLEKKIKYRGLCGKRHAKLHLSEVKKIVDGDIAFLLKSEDPLLMEFYSKLKGQLLKPKALVVYDREAFIYRPGNVRVTLDRNLSTSSDPLEFLDSSLKTRRNMADGMIVLEVKYDEFLPDIVKMAVSEMGRSHTAYSKYAVVRRYE